METQTNNSPNNLISRREALKYIGFGTLGAAAVAGGMNACNFFGGSQPPAETYDIPDPVGNVLRRRDPVTGAEISLLAYGCMRFPLSEEGNPAAIDEEKAMALLDLAYQHGVNYFDTAWFYHQGKSETFVGKALSRYPRESYHIATKMPGRLINSLDHAKEVFAQQLANLQTDYVDFYLLHNLQLPSDYTKVYEEYGVLKYLLEEKAKGRIKRLGISFHGDAKDFTWFLDKHKWDFVMIQANYFDWNSEAGSDFIKKTAFGFNAIGVAEYLYNEVEKRGMPCMIMEPVRGGMLAKLNPDARSVFREADPKRTPASWAMQWIASKPNVLTVLSGMTTMEQVKDNLNTFTTFEPMTAEQYAVVERALTAFQRVKPVLCTECEYCLPCPAGVNIPLVFKTYNYCVSESFIPDIKGERGKEFKRKRRAFLKANFELDRAVRADQCTFCKVCLSKCPQSIPIADKMYEIKGMIKELV